MHLLLPSLWHLLHPTPCCYHPVKLPEPAGVLVKTQLCMVPMYTLHFHQPQLTLPFPGSFQMAHHKRHDSYKHHRAAIKSLGASPE